MSGLGDDDQRRDQRRRAAVRRPGTPDRGASRPRRRTGRRRRRASAGRRPPPGGSCPTRRRRCPRGTRRARSETPNTADAPNAMPSATARTVRVNSSRERVARHAGRAASGTSRDADDDHEHDEQRPPCPGRATDPTARPIAGAARSPRPTEERREGRQEDEHEDGEEVLDDQPADGDVALRRVELVAVAQRPDQDDGARHRDGEAEDEPAADAPAEARAPSRDARGRVATTLWPTAPGIAIRRTASRSCDREVDADAEHQQDDARSPPARRRSPCRRRGRA